MQTPFVLSDVLECPFCGSHKIRRSMRMPFLDGFVVLIGMRPYRCEDCHRRYYNYMWAKPVNAKISRAA